MSAQHMLEFTLAEILKVINPTRGDLETRMRIIDGLRNVVSKIEGLQGATVEPFGSFLSHLYSRWGDLDISVELSNGLHILLPSKKHKQTLLEEVLKALRRTGSFRRLQFLSHARVPILKLESKVQNISCDISINNLSGQMKSKFLLWISLIDHRFRDLVLLVKEWAKANGINNPKGGTFNSYSLSLLVIFHFQTSVPPILPPLEDFYPGNMAAELIGVRADVERHIEEIAASNIARFKNRRRTNHNSLSVLFISFLGKFLDIGTRTMEQGICTYSGRWENIDTNPRWLPRTYTIFIEDPFEQPENTARAVARSKLTKIAEAFRNTYHLLIDPNLRLNSLIPSLARQQISHLFPGLTMVTPRADFWPNPWPNQNAPPDNHLSSVSQHQFQMNWQMNQPKNLKVQYGNYLSVGRPVRATNQQLPREKPQNVYRQKTARRVQNGEQSSLEGQMHASNQQLPREKPLNVYRPKTAQEVQNREQSSLEGQVHPTNQQLPGEKPQNVYRQKTARQVQNGEQSSLGGQVHATNQQLLREKPQNVYQQNGEQSSLGGQVDAIKQQSLRKKTSSRGQNVDRQNASQQVQNGEELSPGGIVRTNQRLSREKPRSQGQNVDRRKNTRQVQNGKQLSLGRQGHARNQHLPREKTRSQGQNVDRQKNQQLPREKSGNQDQNVDQQKTSKQFQGQDPPVGSQIVNPPWPHTLQPSRINNVV